MAKFPAKARARTKGQSARQKARRPKIKIPRWARWTPILLAPLLLLNLAVAFFGNSLVFPLSPFFLRNKVAALGRYALHRPRCLFWGHTSVDTAVARAESKHKLPRGLLAAIVDVESNGRVHRISSAGAMGPGQLTPSTARLLGVSDPFDPAEAIDGAGRYLATQLTTFHHNIRLAVAAYNAGPGAIVNHSVPQNGETEHYVRKVMNAYATSRRQDAGTLASR
jgi:soluble lytic murein transglycosylase-like protein